MGFRSWQASLALKLYPNHKAFHPLFFSDRLKLRLGRFEADGLPGVYLEYLVLFHHYRSIHQHGFHAFLLIDLLLQPFCHLQGDCFFLGAILAGGAGIPAAVTGILTAMLGAQPW